MDKTTVQHLVFYVHKQYCVCKSNNKIKKKDLYYLQIVYTNAERKLGMVNKAIIVSSSKCIRSCKRWRCNILDKNRCMRLNETE